MNIGNSKTIRLLDFIELLEKSINMKSIKILKEMQMGDVKETHSDTSLLKKLTNFQPNTNLELGIKNFVDWYFNYYEIKH